MCTTRSWVQILSSHNGSIMILSMHHDKLNHPALTIYRDSHSAIHLIRNPVYHTKMKHIEVRFNHIRKLVTETKLEVWMIDTEVNIADCMTKSLPEQHFGALRTKMELRQPTEQNKAKQGGEVKSKIQGTEENNTGAGMSKRQPIDIGPKSRIKLRSTPTNKPIQTKTIRLTRTM